MRALTAEATRIPTLASVSRLEESKARAAMKSDTVNPTPATAPTPTIWLHRAPSGNRASCSFTASQLNAVIPTNLPTINPVATPTNTEDGSASTPPESTIPALASANSGTIT
jgi:hypothetical protein